MKDEERHHRNKQTKQNLKPWIWKSFILPEILICQAVNDDSSTTALGSLFAFCIRYMWSLQFVRQSWTCRCGLKRTYIAIWVASKPGFVYGDDSPYVVHSAIYFKTAWMRCWIFNLFSSILISDCSLRSMVSQSDTSMEIQLWVQGNIHFFVAFI